MGWEDYNFRCVKNINLKGNLVLHHKGLYYWFLLNFNE